MKKLLICLFAVGMSLLLPSCWGAKDEEKKTGLLVVSVLDKETYDDCHIKGSINVQLDQLEQFAKTVDSEAEIVLYCTNYLCTASGYAAKKLSNLGFKHVSVYEGGTAEWYQNDLPTEGACKRPYLKQVITKSDDENDDGIQGVTLDELADKMNIRVAA